MAEETDTTMEEKLLAGDEVKKEGGGKLYLIIQLF